MYLQLNLLCGIVPSYMIMPLFKPLKSLDMWLKQNKNEHLLQTQYKIETRESANIPFKFPSVKLKYERQLKSSQTNPFLKI